MSNESFAELSGYLSLDESGRSNWDLVGACFFCFTAATTIGYGNYTPQTDAGKLLLVLYAVVAIPICLKTFAKVSDRGLELLTDRFGKDHKFEKRIERAFRGFDADGSGKLERGEVREAMRCIGYRSMQTGAVCDKQSREV